VSPVRYELGSYIPEDAILHSHRRENLRSYNDNFGNTRKETLWVRLGTNQNLLKIQEIMKVSVTKSSSKLGVRY
jgi:hypothetical protein